MIIELSNTRYINNVTGGKCQCVAKYQVPNENRVWRPIYLGEVLSEDVCMTAIGTMGPKMEYTNMQYLGCINADASSSISFSGSGRVKI